MPFEYIPATAADQSAMLATIGVPSIDTLFDDIPGALRGADLHLPAPLSELELQREIQSLAAENGSLDRLACFRGGGVYNHFIPSIVWRLAGRSEFQTAYTPYQPEISQGVLQVTYEFQSLLCLLTGMEAANAGMYEGATALAEAALMACRLTGRRTVHALDSVNPRHLQVVHTYLAPMGIQLHVAAKPQLDAEAACLLIQSPNFFGYIEDQQQLIQQAHATGALAVVSADPTSLAMFRPPGEFDADIVVGEGQPLGLPLSFGGPYVGIFTCKDQYLRQMPGRIVGKTEDGQGRTGYVLTLQTREQHIRRERATSNICTSEALLAIAATVYMAALGKSGMSRVAQLCYHKAHYAAQRIAALPGYSLPFKGTFFKEFAVQCPKAPRELNALLRERGILGGLDISDRVPNGMLIAVTEMNTRAEIDALVSVLQEAGR